MIQYHKLLRQILRDGWERDDRTGTGTLGVFGAQARFDLRDGFPLVTTKRIHFKSVVHELLWFLKGDTNIQYLEENGVRIWREWADEDGALGRVYGAQWRDWVGVDADGDQVHIDQIQNAVQRLKTNPDCRRIIVTAWQPAELDQMALAPCHCFFQLSTQKLTLEQRFEIFAGGWDVEEAKDHWFKLGMDQHTGLDNHDIPRRRLHLQLYQRSCDAFLGVPFNIASYALLLHMFARVTGMEPGTFTHTYGDLHLYKNHLEQARLQLTRDPRELPQLRIRNRGQDITDFVYDDFELVGYDPYPAIKAEVSV